MNRIEENRNLRIANRQGVSLIKALNELFEVERLKKPAWKHVPQKPS